MLILRKVFLQTNRRTDKRSNQAVHWKPLTSAFVSECKTSASASASVLLPSAEINYSRKCTNCESLIRSNFAAGKRMNAGNLINNSLRRLAAEAAKAAEAAEAEAEAEEEFVANESRIHSRLDPTNQRRRPRCLFPEWRHRQKSALWKNSRCWQLCPSWPWGHGFEPRQVLSYSFVLMS